MTRFEEAALNEMNGLIKSLVRWVNDKNNSGTTARFNR